jgi:hypothetical protein
MGRTSRYARCEAPKRSCTLSTTAANGQSQGDKETGEPDDATSILSGSAGGWEKRPKGPRSQPTQLQSSKSTFSRGNFLSFFAFQEGMLGTPISVLGGSPTVSDPFGDKSSSERVTYATMLRKRHFYPTFKGVWYTAVNFALLPLRDTKPDQCPRPRRPANDDPGCHGLGDLVYSPQQIAPALPGQRGRRPPPLWA